MSDVVEYSLIMGTNYNCANFGPSEEEYMAADESFTPRVVGSLVQFFEGKPGGFILLTCIHTGYVRVVVRSTTDPEPLPVNLAEWEDYVITTVNVPSGELTAQPSFGDGDTTPNLVHAPGRYGVRILARERDIAPDEDLSVPAPENYLVDIWPAPPEGIPEEWQTRSAAGKELATSA